MWEKSNIDGLLQGNCSVKLHSIGLFYELLEKLPVGIGTFCLLMCGLGVHSNQNGWFSVFFQK